MKPLVTAWLAALCAVAPSQAATPLKARPAAVDDLPLPSSQPQLPFVPTFAHDDQKAEPIDQLHCAKPEYPRTSLRNEETGQVVLRFKIGADGLIQQWEIARSSGFRDLDLAAAAAYRACKYRPATFNGKAIPGYGHVSYVFTLG